MRSADTSPEAHARHLEVYRANTPERRLIIAARMSDDVLAVTADGIRARHPEYDDRQVGWALHRLRHGDETFRVVWPHAPLLAP